MKSISESLEDNAPHYRALTSCEVCNESMSVQYDSPRKICHACERYNIAFNEGLLVSADQCDAAGFHGLSDAIMKLKRRTK